MTCAGCNLIETAPVTLLDGRTVCSSCEDYRHLCEARYILARPSTFERRQYIDAVERKRGAVAADALRATILLLWEARKVAAA